MRPRPDHSGQPDGEAERRGASATVGADARAPYRETTTDLCYDAWIESATLNVLMPFSRCRAKASIRQLYRYQAVDWRTTGEHIVIRT
ncbi:hypothetical protein SAMN04489749_0188 [Bifidobacterium longum]|nr:hypothetical protein SAMN04489749_0188 [Bifidobacterium longum]